MSRFLYILITNIRIRRHRRVIFCFIVYDNRRKTNLESTFPGAPYCNKTLLALLQSVFLTFKQWHTHSQYTQASTPWWSYKQPQRDPFLKYRNTKVHRRMPVWGHLNANWVSYSFVSDLHKHTSLHCLTPIFPFQSLQIGPKGHWIWIQHRHDVELNKTGQYSLPDTSYCFGYSTEWVFKILYPTLQITEKPLSHVQKHNLHLHQIPEHMTLTPFGEALWVSPLRSPS